MHQKHPPAKYALSSWRISPACPVALQGTTPDPDIRKISAQPISLAELIVLSLLSL
jgi:hypothetical protein